MLKFILPLAVLPVLGLAQPAQAQQYWWQGNPDAYSAYGDNYAPDPYASREDRFDEEQYQLYRREMERRYHRRAAYNQDYFGPDQGYQPDQQPVPYAAPVYPVNPKVVQTKPVVKKVPKPATAPATTTTASTAPAAKPQPAPITDTPAVTPAPAQSAAKPETAPVTAPAAPAASGTAQAATTAQKPAAKGPVTCDKGASIVSSFGFDKVSNKSCEGASLVYNAERGGKPFEIEVNPKSGELTAVKKL